MTSRHWRLLLAVVLVGGAIYLNTSSDSSNELRPAPLPLLATTQDVNTPTTETPPAKNQQQRESLQSKIENYKPGKGAEYRAELKKIPIKLPTWLFWRR